MITLTNNQPLTPDAIESIPTARAYTTIRADALIAAVQQIAADWDAEGRLGQTCLTPAQMCREFGAILEGMGIENATMLIMGYDLGHKITVVPTAPARRKKSRSNNTPPANHAATMHCNANSQGLGE